MHPARDFRRRATAGKAARAGCGRRGPGRTLACEDLEPRWLLAGDWIADPPEASESVVSAGANLEEPIGQPFVVNLSMSEDAEPLAGSSSPGGFAPQQLRHAYGFDQIFFQGGTIVGDGTGQTIAIVNAYHTPTAAADLAAFNAYFGLPEAPSFLQVDQSGGTDYPGSNSGWALETALDVQWAHAFAPGADILLVEAESPSFSDLMTAVDYARHQPGVSVVSMSWGTAGEFATETNYDFHFTTPVGHEGVTFFAAAGNSGGPGGYPAYSPNVVAVGGTTLVLDGANNIAAESAWSGSGGGISQYESQPGWQNGVVTQTSTKRAMPDVAFDANPSTGVPVYDTFNNSAQTPWTKVAGTSFATPSWAALVAIADQGRTLAGLPVLDMPELMTTLYAMPATNFNDITTGASGGTIPQSAGPGYDLVTGLGTPRAHLVAASLVGESSAPTGLTLAPESDTGVSAFDAMTMLNNASAGAVLAFEVTGTIAGATVTIEADGTPIGSATATGSATTVVTDGATALADGGHSITARQTLPGESTSGPSPAVALFVDTTAPVSSVVDVAPDPRATPLEAITITFSEVVSGLDLSALELVRDSGGNLLSPSQTLETTDGVTWTLGNLSGLTAAAGYYELFLSPALSGASDAAGNVAGGASTGFTVGAAVVDRLLFYNRSTYDGDDPAANAADDAAVASDKFAYLPGDGVATSGSVSNYSRGINGLMVDIAAAGTITADDFTFTLGDNNAPETWVAAPDPLAVVVRAGAGTNGADRVEIVWADGAIANSWLQVVVEGNDELGGFNTNTGLAASDVFYFGSRIGDTFENTPANVFLTTSADEISIRGETISVAAIDDAWDLDRNGLVLAGDQIIARANVGFITRIDISSPPAAPQTAPPAAGGDDL